MAAAAGAAINIAASLIGGIFKHHAVAVKNEAAALNEAVPETLTSFTNIVKAANAGQISPAEAANYVESAMQQYEAVVYNQFGVKKKDCNGPCVVEKTLRAGAESIKAALQAGSGVATVGQFYGNAGFNGAPGTTYVVNIPSAVAATVNSVAASVGLDVNSLGTVKVGTNNIPVLYIVGGLFLLMFLLLSFARPSAQPQVLLVQK